MKNKTQKIIQIAYDDSFGMTYLTDQGRIFQNRSTGKSDDIGFPIYNMTDITPEL